GRPPVDTAALAVDADQSAGLFRREPGRREPGIAEARGAVDGGLGGRADPHVDRLGRARRDARTVELVAAVAAHRLPRKQATDRAERLLEGRGPVFDAGPHRVELLGA